MWTSTLWLPESRKFFKSFKAFAGADASLEGSNFRDGGNPLDTPDTTSGIYHSDLEIHTTIMISTLASTS